MSHLQLNKKCIKVHLYGVTGSNSPIMGYHILIRPTYKKSN